jgi:hypothetical protein
MDRKPRARVPDTRHHDVASDKVDESHDYALKAAIVDHGKPVMATANPPLVLTKGRPFQVDLVVSPVAN